MASLTPASPIVYSGAQTALYVVAPSALEVPFTTAELQTTAEKEDVTGSTSIGADHKVWSEFGEGKHGGSFNWSGFWRIGSAVAPFDFKEGATYAMKAYARRPGWDGGSDAGTGKSFNLFIDSNSLTMDPKRGGLEWKVSGTVNGPVVDF